MFLGKLFWQLSISFFLFINIISGNGLVEQKAMAGSKENEKLKSDLKRYAEIISTLDTHYADSIDINEVVIQSIKRMLTSLDPFSSLQDGEAFRDFQFFQSGMYSGIGANLIEIEGERVVHSTIPGSPASEAGILPGDIIFAIDDLPLRGLPLPKVKQLFHGVKGSLIRIILKRFGLTNTLELNISRELLPELSIPLCFQLKPTVIYLKLVSFSDVTQMEFDECLAPHLPYLNGLIIDLRDNVGGSLKSGIQVADRLLDINDLIMTTQGDSSNTSNEYYATTDVKKLDVPVVVIINNKTASAAEILAGAIKDNRKGLIVGQNSFGKGLIQTVLPLKSGHALFLTTGKWFTPSGINVQHNNMKFLRKRIFFSEEENRYYAANPFKDLFFNNSGVDKGGISPDIYLKTRELSPFLVSAILDHLFFNFSREFWFKYRKLAESGKVDEALVSEFFEFLKSKKINVSIEEFKKNIDYIKLFIQSNLLLMAGKSIEAYIVLLKNDPYVLLAIDSLKQTK